MVSKIFEGDYKIFPREKLILEVLKGEITPNSLILFKKSESLDEFYCNHYDVITDLRNTTFDVTTSQIEDYVIFLSKNKLIGDRKCIILINSPSQSIYTGIYQNYVNQYSHKVHVTYDLEHAMLLLGRPDTLAIIDRCIRDLSINPDFVYAHDSDY